MRAGPPADAQRKESVPCNASWSRQCATTDNDHWTWRRNVDARNDVTKVTNQQTHLRNEEKCCRVLGGGGDACYVAKNCNVLCNRPLRKQSPGHSGFWQTPPQPWGRMLATWAKVTRRPRRSCGAAVLCRGMVRYLAKQSAQPLRLRQPLGCGLGDGVADGSSSMARSAPVSSMTCKS